MAGKTGTHRSHLSSFIRFLGFLILLVQHPSASAAVGDITTVAGGSVGDGSDATAVSIIAPRGVAVDSAGNLYIADTGNNRIRKVNATTGIISTVAGNGTEGFSGDGGVAVAASLTFSIGVAVDGAGNLYLSDTGNHRIRKVSATTGLITTVAGNGTAGFGGDGGVATAASLNSPWGVAVNSTGDLYIADTGNHRIRKVDATTGLISTIAGTDTAGFSGDGGVSTAANLGFSPGVTIDDAGNLYIADTSNLRIRKVDMATGLISTVAGNGARGANGKGDGGAATAASLDVFIDVAVDTAGNLYIAEQFGNRIRKVDVASGFITTVAGTGGWDSSGDGGAATAAGIVFPSSVAVDGVGNLYIASQLNHRIRKVTAATGLISTVAGNGSPGFFGDGGTATAVGLAPPDNVAVDGVGNLYIAGADSNRIHKVTTATGLISTVAGDGSVRFNGEGGTATAASLISSADVGVDGSGNLYIADTGNNRIRKVNATTGIISILAGNGRADFSGDGSIATAASLKSPTRVAIDGAGNLYIADYENHRIRKVDAATGLITTVAGNGIGGFSGDGGTATAAELASPSGVAIDGVGNLYIADTNNHRIRKVDATSGLISTVAGTGATGFTSGSFSGDGGAATAANLNYPADITVDVAGNLYIADTNNFRIRKVDVTTGLISTMVGDGNQGFSGDGGAATAASLDSPTSVVIDGAGNLYIADTGNHRIRKVDVTIGLISTVAGDGNQGFSGDGGTAKAAGLDSPTGVAVDVAGNLYIADSGNHRIRKATAATGLITTVAGNGSATTFTDGGSATAASLVAPSSVTVDGDDNLYIADTLHHRIRKVAAATGLISTVAGTGISGFSGDGGVAIVSSLNSPTSVVIDGAGNLYIADQFNNRIRKVDVVTGRISTVAGDGAQGFSGDGVAATTASLNSPSGISIDSVGNLLIADTVNNRIRQVDATTGLITTIAGDGIQGFSGDGGVATKAMLNRPSGVAVDGAGNLYIADTNNHRIRQLTAATGLISTVAGDGNQGFSGDGGAATVAGLSRPKGVSVDSAGNLFIADTGNRRIRKVQLAGVIANNSPTQSGGGGGLNIWLLLSLLLMGCQANSKRPRYCGDGCT